MYFLALNVGSSTVKFKLVKQPEGKIKVRGIFKNYAEDSFTFEYFIGDFREKLNIKEKDYVYSQDYLFNFLLQKNLIEEIEDIRCVVHRIVHGGEVFPEPVELTDSNIAKIVKFNDFAPLHNPFAIEKVKDIKKDYGYLKQYGVFDTSFNLAVAKEDYLYGLPLGYYENLKVRRYGFHGISHEYVSKQIKNIIKKDNLKHISCHLGSGSSICALLNGKVIDNSFGFTPNENLIMATRSGEIDYDAIIFIKKKLGLNDDEVEELLNKESGLLGISGYTNDMKQLLADYDSKERAKLAVDMYINTIMKFIGSFIIKLKGVDCLTFTGGVGAGSDAVRKMICDNLEFLGIKIDNGKNAGKIDVDINLDISAKNSNAKIFVIPTDEELEMCNQIKDFI